MDVGKMDTSVLFESVTVTVDSTGSTIQTWAEITNAPRKAEYIPLKGHETVSGGKLTDKIKFKLRIRRNTDIDTTDRVTVRSVVYEIMSIQDFGRDNNLILWCGSL